MESYTLPRNAVQEIITEVMLSAPDLWPIVDAELTKIDPVSSDGNCDPKLIWPDTPYHYGMGKIQEYDTWLSSLNPQERQAEVAASEQRYESHYQNVANQLVTRLEQLGRDLSALRPDPKKNQGTNSQLIY
jgi:hypothetical protein